MKAKLLNLLFLFLCLNFYGQSSMIKGEILNSLDNTPVASATISVVGFSEIAFADENGNFTLEINQPPPFEIQVEAIGFEIYRHRVLSANAEMTIHLYEDVTSLDQVVLSASRTPERVFESPVSIERMGAKEVENTTAASFYDGLENLKGVDVNASSLTFKSVNTRGFAGFSNTRFVQLVDGVDNSSPGLNFALGNLIGLNELDVHSVELLPGAASALYGANAFNGIMIMRSKSPFTNPGISVYAKSGVTSSENAGTNHFIDAGFRVAKKINDKFAIKLTGSLFKGTDWFATDTRNVDPITGDVISGNREDTPSYNGANQYGDEVDTQLDGIGKVSRTGYNEGDLIDYNADSFKADLTLHFKPFSDNSDTEIILGSKYGTGNAIYQGASRYALRNFVMHQHKLELRGKNFMFRAYASVENAGDSYDIRFAGINVNKSWKDNRAWFTEYAGAYAGLIPGVTGGSDAVARSFADRDRYAPGSSEFKQAFQEVIKNPDLAEGAKFVDRSQLYHSDFNYNFRDVVKFAELQVGGSARRYVLDSDGTIFTDSENENIIYDEFGIYTQLQKKMLDDRLKFTGSIRYDKSQNFEGNFSPRLSVSFSPDEKKKHNIRASFQTGFRNPTTQEQYIGLDLGNSKLIGSAKDNLERYTVTVDNSVAGQGLGFNANYDFTGQRTYENSFILSSAIAFGKIAATGDFANAIQVLEKTNLDLVKPEKVTSYEIGYRGKVAKKTVVDLSVYYNLYKDFITITNVLVPNYGNANLSDAGVLPVPGIGAVTLPNAAWALINGDSEVASLYTNTDIDVSSYGVNVGLETVFGDGYDFGINYSFANQDFDDSKNPGYGTGFNTPKHKVKVSFGNTHLYNDIGFGINIRWQDKYYWESSFIDGNIDARTMVDAQAMYHIEKWNSKVKIGAVNILGQEYVVAPGTGRIGSQFYVSWTYNF